MNSVSVVPMSGGYGLKARGKSSSGNEANEIAVPSEWLVSFLACSSTEDFLAMFGLPFDEKVVMVNRLHILRRFGERLERIEAEAGPAVSDPNRMDRFRKVRAAMEASYNDFLLGGALEYRVFKVLCDAADGFPTPVAEPSRRVRL